MDDERINELREILQGQRDEIEEELKQQADDDELRDLLEDVEDALELLSLEDGQADVGRLEQLSTRVASRLEK